MNARVLLDASFWIALRDGREACHTEARQVTGELLRQRVRLVFTSLILAETMAHFSRSPLTRSQIMDDAQSNPAMEWEPVSHADELAAFGLLRRQRDKSHSFCDAVSFVLMKRLSIPRAASFDEHFRQFGEFTIVGG